MGFMPKRVIHISEEEAARDFAGILARVRSGAEVVIDGHAPVIVALSESARGRFVSECIALAKAHEEETGKAPTLDTDFASDLAEIVKNRKPWNPPAWE